MPRIDIWIRKDDMPAWEAIKDKPAFIHNAIAMRDAYLKIPPKEQEELKDHLKAFKPKQTTPKPAKTFVEPLTYKNTTNWGA